MLCPYLAVYLLVFVVLQFVLLFPSYKRKWVNRKCWSDCLITGLTAFMHRQELSTLVVCLCIDTVVYSIYGLITSASTLRDICATDKRRGLMRVDIFNSN